MLLTEKRLRALIHDILLEGVREDAAALEVDLEDNPEALEQFQSLSSKPKWVNWLADRYLRRKYPVDDTLPDVLPLVASFASKDAAISQKYGSNEQFRTAVDRAFPPESRGWQNPSDATKMSASALNTLLVLHDRKKQRIEVDRADESWKQDKIGQFGPWALYFPTSQQNSVNIAGFDRDTLVSYTTWCTARTGGSNLFYHYAGGGIMLFYALDESKPPTDPKSRISLGYVRGKLRPTGAYGGVTVDARNNGLKMPALQKIFGSHLSGILAAAEAVVKQHGAEHPVKTEFVAACQDVVKFKRMLSGLSDDEAGNLCRKFFDSAKKAKRDVSPDVAFAAASHKSVTVRQLIAQNPQVPPHALEKLASDADVTVRRAAAFNLNTSPHFLEKLASDADFTVRRVAASNPNTSPHVLEKLASDTVDVRACVASNPAVPIHLLEKLAADTVEHVRSSVACNSKTPLPVLEKLAVESGKSVRNSVASRPAVPMHLLEKLAADTDEGVRSSVAYNSKTPLHVLEKLAVESDMRVRNGVACNPSAPSHVLEKLAADTDERIRSNVARNVHMSPHILEKLAGDTAVNIRMAVLYNKKTPIHVREKLVSDPNRDVSRLAGSQVARSPSARPETLEQLSNSRYIIITRAVARNPKTPLSALRALSQHGDDKTREAAQAALAKLQPMGEARRLAHRIIAELKRR